MTNLFEDFEKWYPALSQSRNVLANIEAKKFDEKEDRARAAGIKRGWLMEAGIDKVVAEEQAKIFATDSDEEDIKGLAESAKDAYEPRVNELFTTKFNDFYDSAPEGVREEAYSLLEHTRPKSDLAALTEDMRKAAELHQTFGGLGLKIERYLHGGTRGAEKTDIEKEVKEKLFEYYDNKFLNTPERRAMFEKMVEVLKKWAEKKPQRAVAVYHSIYKKNKEEFDKLITKDNAKEYQTVAIDSDELAKLYSTASRTYDISQTRKRALENSGMLPIFAE